MKRPVALKIDLNLVFAGLYPKPLERPVEVVDDAGVIAVDEYFCLARFDLQPQTVAWMMLGVALSAYEHWLDDESVSLPQALGDAFDVVRAGLDDIDRSRT